MSLYSVNTIATTVPAQNVSAGLGPECPGKALAGLSPQAIVYIIAQESRQPAGLVIGCARAWGVFTTVFTFWGIPVCSFTTFKSTLDLILFWL